MLLFMTSSAVVVGHAVTTGKTHPQTCLGTSSPQIQNGYDPNFNSATYRQLQMPFDAIHALQTGAVVSLYRRTLLVLSAAALSHIAVIGAVTLPQLYLQPTP